MEDFDKLFADKMRQAGAPDFSDEDWQQLLPQLDAERQRRWRMIPLWWLGALGGLLLCSNIAWWWMWQQSEKGTNALRTEWEQVRKDGVNRRDTVYQKEIVYQYDTLYRTIIYRTSAGNAAQGFGSIVTPGKTIEEQLGIPAKAPVPPVGNAAVVAIAPAVSQATGAKENAPQEAETHNPVAVSDSALSQNTALEIPVKAANVPENEVAATPLKHAPRLAVLIPHHFRIGAGGGLLVPQSADLSGNIGFLTGLTGELAFSDQLALTMEAGVGGITFNGTVYNEKLGLPPNTPPNDDYKIRSFGTDEGLKSVLQLAFGMRYWIRASHKLSPYLGFGYASQWHPPFELQGIYVNEDTGKKKEFSVEVPSSQVSLVDINAGIRYRFLRRFFWQSGLEYEFKIDPNQPGIPRYWGLKSSVLYEF